MAVQVFLAAGTMPTAMSLASIFNSKASSFSNASPGSQGVTPSQVDGPHATALALVNRARVRPCLGCFAGIVPRSHSPSGSSTSRFRLWRHLELLLSLSQGLARIAVFALVWASLHDFTLDLAFRLGHQRLRLSGGGSLSLASGFDAGGTLGQGWSNTPLVHACQRLRVRLHSCPHPRL